MRIMADRAFAWAIARGKTRTNPVHGEDEAKLVIVDWFENATEKGQRTDMTGTATIQDM